MFLIVWMISCGSFVFRADRKRIDAAEFLEELGFAFHHRHCGRGADIAEAENGCSVGNNGDRVLFYRQVKGLFRVFCDCLANTCNAGRVGHREVAARFQRHFRDDLDLAAEVHQKRAVRDIYDLDAVDIISGSDDLFVMFFGRGINGNIADKKILADADDIDAFDVAAGTADRGCNFAEFSGLT